MILPFLFGLIGLIAGLVGGFQGGLLISLLSGVSGVVLGGVVGIVLPFDWNTAVFEKTLIIPISTTPPAERQPSMTVPHECAIIIRDKIAGGRSVVIPQHLSSWLIDAAQAQQILDPPVVALTVVPDVGTTLRIWVEPFGTRYDQRHPPAVKRLADAVFAVIEKAGITPIKSTVFIPHDNPSRQGQVSESLICLSCARLRRERDYAVMNGGAI